MIKKKKKKHKWGESSSTEPGICGHMALHFAPDLQGPCPCHLSLHLQREIQGPGWGGGTLTGQVLSHSVCTQLW